VSSLGSGHPVAVPRFTPFTALRYRDPDLDDLVAPPYDVLSDADLDRYGAASPHNITHVDVPRESDGPDRYARAAATLDRWIAEGVMVLDDRPSFTIYRMSFTDDLGAPRTIVGVLGGLEVVEPGSGGVLPHERVTPKASTDRLDLTRATRANLSPVWGLSLARGLTAALEEPGEALSSVAVDGVVHTVERVADAERVATIAAIIGRDDVLIADGHHRYGVAQTYLSERPGERADDTASDTLDRPTETLAFVNELVDEQLSVAAIHRLYRGVTSERLVAVLAESFEVSDADGPIGAATLLEMTRRGALCLVSDGGATARWLRPRQGAFEGVRAIDGALLEHALEGTDVEVAYQHGADHVVDAVRSGRAVAGVLIRPVGVPEIERTAREGLLMPPKSTFFTPKLLTGLVVRLMR
jgi:uncharacterized protein (DUF1015 family)